ncbi:DUF2213 domain-containing protein [Citrobacter sp.]|uniref:DUF2213 domain-containing protein n=1 Tax=Citrobacter sp. TaxID=1896336 RepID=UPI002FC6493F
MAQPSARETDLNGFMLVRGCPLSREGIYEYSAKQISPDFDPENPDRIVKVYRPKEEISDPDAINSFRSVPLIDEHEMLNGIGGKHPEYTPPEDKGVDGVLTDNVYFDNNDGWLKGDLKIFSRRLQNTVIDKDDLSLGFGCLFYVESGSWNGQEYEVIQRRIRGNHLAVVDDGRIEGARILDAMCFDSLNLDLLVKPMETTEMKKGVQTRKIIKGSAADSALEKLKALVPALQEIIAEGQAEVSGGAAQPEATADSNPEAAAASAPEVPVQDTPEENAEAAAAPAADPEPAADPVAEPESGAAPQEQKPEDVTVLIQQVEALLAQLKDMMAPAPATDEANPDMPAQDAEDCTQGAMVATDNVDPTVSMNEETVDNAEEKPAMDEGNSSAGLPTGSLTIEAKGQDAALKQFYADNVKKEKLYKRLSNVVGVFDCAAMDSKEVAAYGAKKLGIKCAKGQETVAVETYLDGLAKGQKIVAERAVKEAAAMDSRSSCSEIDNWLKETK